MELFLILSREHETLPLAELKAVLDAEEIPSKVKVFDTGIVKVETSSERTPEVFGRRLGYAHEICELIMECNLEDLEQNISLFDWESVVEKDFALRVKKMDILSKKKNSDVSGILNTSDMPNISNTNNSNSLNVPENNENSVKIDSQAMEKDLGTIIKSSVGEDIKVKLENPTTFIRILILGSRVLVGKRAAKINKKHFYELKPHKRPFFYPGSMSPKLARCMVNLSRIKEGDLLLDPFCGTGGILIEAGIVGSRLIGTDIDEKMVNGTAENLKHCDIKDFQVFQSDARHLNLEEKVKAVVTDPPYGISASTAGEQSGKLYKDFLQSVSDNMLDNGRICMATPHYIDVNALIQGTKFKILERHEIRMHKSLTRVISLMEKIN